MDDYTVNKILLEYLNYSIEDLEEGELSYRDNGLLYSIRPFTEDLNAIVPVVERLKRDKVVINFYFNGEGLWVFEAFRDSAMRKQIDVVNSGEVPQIVFSHALVECISELPHD